MNISVKKKNFFFCKSEIQMHYGTTFKMFHRGSVFNNTETVNNNKNAILLLTLVFLFQDIHTLKA